MNIFDDALSKAKAAPLGHSPEELEAYAREVVMLQTKLNTIKDCLDAATDALISELPRNNVEVGEHLVDAGKYQININVAERWTWDQDLLAELLNADPELPDCAQMKVAINKRKFEAADSSTRIKLLDALTRTPAKPKLKIEAI